MGGIDVSIKQQRKALDRAGIGYTTDPADEYDLLHVNVPDPASLWHVRKARRAGIPVVMHTHVTHDDFRNSLRFSNLLSHPLRQYLAWAYSLADLLICPSKYAESVVTDHYGGETTVVSNGIDTDRLDGIAGRRREARDRFGIDDTDTVVFTVGIVYKRKGLSTFVEVAERVPDAEFRWFGKRYNRLLTQRHTHRLVANAPSNVTFTGFIDDIRDAYAAGDVFLYPIHVENQGIPALEAAYCGCPLVLRDHPVFAEDFTDDDNCLKATSPSGFETQIRRLRRNPNLGERLTERARETVATHTLDVVGENLRTAYRTAMESGR